MVTKRSPSKMVVVVVVVVFVVTGILPFSL